MTAARWVCLALFLAACSDARLDPAAPDGAADGAPPDAVPADQGPDAQADAGALDMAADAQPDADLRRCQDNDGDGASAGCAGALDCDDGDPAVRPGAPERCNQFDDDCDGRVDEDWAGLGQVCHVGVGGCGVASVRVCRADGVGAVCPVSAGVAADEICNDVDDDCDGAADEGLTGCCPQPGVIRPCSEDVGRCQAGVQTCGADRAWANCDGVRPMAEACNGEDDDCDGVVDEGVAASACGGCEAPPSEACNGADDDCDGRIDEGVTNVCGRCGLVPDEACNGQDDDCDGVADEGVANRCGACGRVGTETCDATDEDCDGQVDEGLRNGCGECGPERVEVCNGVDDDCDGGADEGLAGQGEPCHVGVGACRAEGLTVCGPGGLGCDAAPGPGGAETCDGLDQDCDGRVDEGACEPCASPEVCNGEDDDCDGATDEGVANACGGCGPLTERCNGEDDDCDGATDEGVQQACGGCEPPPPERCNGEDDDCDGRIDEAFPILGQPCRNGVGRCAIESTMRCLSEDRAGCGPAPQGASPEACNGQDDDCDGQVDEGLRNACGACGPQPLERCDGLDQDCDGAVDEAFDLQRDVRHCGACDAACDYASADRCTAGACACGAEAACAADAFCVDRGLPTARCVPLDTLLPPMERP